MKPGPVTAAALGDKDRANLLIVDDRPSNLLSLKAVLQRPDYNIVLANSGEEALAFLLRDDFALILLDVAMPGLDGFQTAALIKQRERSKKIPIIFVTASVYDLDNIFRGYTVGAVDYLQKPVDPHAVRAKVTVFVELWRQSRQIERQAEKLRESEVRERELMRLRAESALAESEAQYQATFDEAPVGIGHAGPDGRWLRVNRRLCATFGVDREELLSRQFLDRAHPEESGALAAAFEEVVSGHGPAYRGEIRFVRDAGEVLWLSLKLSLLRDVGGTARQVIVIAEDVTERRRTEEALRVSEARFRRLRESGLIGISFWTMTGTITDANDAFLNMSGHSRADLDAGRIHWSQLTPATSETQVKDDARALAELRSSGVFHTYQKEIARPDGQRLAVLVGGALLDGTVPTIVGFFVDVTERQRIEVERARLVGELRDALQSRDDFLSIAAHELKTPITPLQLHARGLIRALNRAAPGDPVSPERVRRAAEAIEQSGKRLERLVDNLLDLSRIRVGRLSLEFEDVDLAAVTREIIDRLRAETERAGCTLTLAAKDAVVGRWDRLRVEQVVTNLLTNAVKYGRGHPIEIEVGGDAQNGRVVVRDHGIGIEPDAQSRIFERFERLVPVRHFGGFGLGLWIVRQIIEAHGGRIEVWSQPGEGSKFTIELPRIPAVRDPDVTDATDGDLTAASSSSALSLHDEPMLIQPGH